MFLNTRMPSLQFQEISSPSVRDHFSSTSALLQATWAQSRLVDPAERLQRASNICHGTEETCLMKVPARIFSCGAQCRRRWLSVDSSSRVVDVLRAIARALGDCPWMTSIGL
jgi:hypothetical protein